MVAGLVGALDRMRENPAWQRVMATADRRSPRWPSWITTWHSPPHDPGTPKPEVRLTMRPLGRRRRLNRPEPTGPARPKKGRPCPGRRGHRAGASKALRAAGGRASGLEPPLRQHVGVVDADVPEVRKGVSVRPLRRQCLITARHQLLMMERHAGIAGCPPALGLPATSGGRRRWRAGWWRRDDPATPCLACASAGCMGEREPAFALVGMVPAGSRLPSC
jgi:hypothetical protein